MRDAIVGRVVAAALAIVWFVTLIVLLVRAELVIAALVLIAGVAFAGRGWWRDRGVRGESRPDHARTSSREAGGPPST